MNDGKAFEEWVKKNYPGRFMPEPPENLDISKEMYQKIGKVQYGPIDLEDIPDKFKNA